MLSFGTQVEIIEPAYLKKVVADTAKKIYEKATGNTLRELPVVNKT